MPDALQQLLRYRWSLEGCHLIRGTQLHGYAHRCPGNDAGVIDTEWTAALNLLRVAGFQSIRSRMQLVNHDIMARLGMVRRLPHPDLC